MAREEVEPPDKADAAFHELVITSAELMVNIGIVGSIRGRWPEYAQENWLERLEEMNNEMKGWMGEIQDFAGAHD